MKGTYKFFNTRNNYFIHCLHVSCIILTRELRRLLLLHYIPYICITVYVSCSKKTHNKWHYSHWYNSVVSIEDWLYIDVTVSHNISACFDWYMIPPYLVSEHESSRGKNTFKWIENKSNRCGRIKIMPYRTMVGRKATVSFSEGVGVH